MKKNKLIIFSYAIPLFIISRKIYKLLKRESERNKLKDSVVIITGASEGIGKELAIEFAKQGSKIVLASRSIDKLQKVENQLKEKYVNCEAISVPTDVSRKEDCINLIETTLEKFNKIDILINNAGIVTYDYFYNTSDEEIKKIMDVNYWGVIHCTKAVLPYMMKNKKGRIVNISSFVGKRAMPGMLAYSSSKFAIQAIGEGLRAELRKYGIKVTTICPTATKTELLSNALSKRVKFSQNIGMSANRVAKETINAMLENKREHIIGIPEKIFLFTNNFFASFYDFVLSFAPKFMLKD
ncbi:MAG: ketoacyl reductase [Candidatus Sericytochromatia bacterium]|nr:MAG: ketoacyl reductase [Candidatus Sericytochromatia bacterium]